LRDFRKGKGMLENLPKAWGRQDSEDQGGTTGGKVGGQVKKGETCGEVTEIVVIKGGGAHS